MRELWRWRFQIRNLKFIDEKLLEFCNQKIPYSHSSSLSTVQVSVSNVHAGIFFKSAPSLHIFGTKRYMFDFLNALTQPNF